MDWIDKAQVWMNHNDLRARLYVICFLLCAIAVTSTYAAIKSKYNKQGK